MKGGIVLLDPQSGQVQRRISLQYNPDSLSRTLQVQGIGGESGDRLDVLRLKGPPVETIKLEAEIDATDQLESPDRNVNARDYGIHPQLAALETLVYPSSAQLTDNNDMAQRGMLEIAGPEMPLTLFMWSKSRVMPVRLTDFSITEEAFDTSLNPIRAKVNLGMRVLSVSDVGFEHTAGHLFMTYLQQKEQLVEKSKSRG
jgi:hypothetical protein